MCGVSACENRQNRVSHGESVRVLAALIKTLMQYVIAAAVRNHFRKRAQTPHLSSVLLSVA